MTESRILVPSSGLVGLDGAPLAATPAPLRADLSPAPPRVLALPRTPDGTPVPFYATNASPTGLEMPDDGKLARCRAEGLCATCGQPLGNVVLFVCEPAALFRRWTMRYPLHEECGAWVAFHLRDGMVMLWKTWRRMPIGRPGYTFAPVPGFASMGRPGEATTYTLLEPRRPPDAVRFIAGGQLASEADARTLLTETARNLRADADPVDRPWLLRRIDDGWTVFRQAYRESKQVARARQVAP